MALRVAGIHHLKFAVSELNQSIEFYEKVFGAKRIAAFDHFTPGGALFAVILDFPGLGTALELRLEPKAAAAQAGFDPVTISVDTADDLRLWNEHLDRLDIPHSPVLSGFVAWLVVFEDPDRRRLRLYTLESHGPEIEPSIDDRWLGSWSTAFSEAPVP